MKKLSTYASEVIISKVCLKAETEQTDDEIQTETDDIQQQKRSLERSLKLYSLQARSQKFG